MLITMSEKDIQRFKVLTDVREICTLSLIWLAILDFRISDFCAHVSSFPETFYYKHTL